jgi:putative peptide zinc metalloprotease protein
MMEGDGEIFPTLNPLLKLYPSAASSDGAPQWTLYHPTSNQYFKIGWAEFELLSRFHKVDNRNQLIDMVNTETSLSVDEDDLVSLFMFLSENGLLAGTQQMMAEQKSKSFWQKMMHGYLYFTIPLIRPDNFLNRMLPYVRPLFEKRFFLVMMALLCTGIVMALPRSEEFFNSFTMIFSAEGIILSAIVLTCIKFIHEFAHGFMAKIYNVPVPHMGVAFIVLYPVFYTEVTGAWRLGDRRARMRIGLAGIQSELYLATIALILWNFMMPGLGQMICFTIIMISLVGSLFINLNPLMRFDGYYVLSDYSGIENLHAVAIDYARAFIRKTCLGWNEDAPHDYEPAIVTKLTLFGLIIMLYRLSLFLGIAILVYHVFMKPLGLFAMIFELVWFIGLPILNEIKTWRDKRENFMHKTRFWLFIGLLGMALMAFVIPWRGVVHAPAVMHAQQYQSVFAPAPSKIETVNVIQGQSVQKGDVLVSLSSVFLDAEITKQAMMLRGLELQKRREQTNVDLFRARETSIDVDIETASKILDGLEAKAYNMVVLADFDGQVVDVNDGLSVGQTIGVRDHIMRIITPHDFRITAYVGEDDLKRLRMNAKAVFRSTQTLWSGVDATILSYGDINNDVLDFEILSSLHDGQILSQQDEGQIKPINSIYKVILKLDEGDYNKGHPYIVGGTVKIDVPAQSAILKFAKEAFHIVRRELSFN